ncbi:MAG: MOSC domain-containing protein [Phycisphaerales bacterium]
MHQISVSAGGVPKRPVPRARVTVAGIEGDDQNDKRHHGGPDRAVCLFSLEVIELLRAEGHPIRPGSTGENLTIHGLDWGTLVPGTRLAIGAQDVPGGECQPPDAQRSSPAPSPATCRSPLDACHLEVTSYTQPCSTIRGSFLGLDHRRIQQSLHPGQSRLYARVLREGIIAVGDPVRIMPPSSDTAEQGMVHREKQRAAGDE